MNFCYVNGRLFINGAEVKEITYKDGTKETFPKPARHNINEAIVCGNGNVVMQSESLTNTKITISK
jgi:hypothetical protein